MKSAEKKSIVIYLVSLIAVAAPALGFNVNEGEQPNILMILCDDLGYGDIGIHGNTGVETPNIDRLGQESVRFSNFYVAPVCAPTRSSLMTGRYYHRTGVYGVGDGKEYMNLSETAVPKVLKQNGYTTGMSGKWHLGDCAPYDPASRGFDSVLTTGNYYEHQNPSFVLATGERTEPVVGWTSDLLADDAISFITENRSRPFFYYLAFPQTHNPWHCPDAYMQKYIDKGCSPSLSLFYGMLEQTDASIGRVLQALEDLGLDKKTMVVFASDNGPIERPSLAGFKNLTDAEWAQRNPAELKGKKAQIWENGVRVPLFIRWSGHFSPEEVTTAAHVIDLFPTFLDFSGTTLPADNLPVDGRSLRPLLEGRTSAWPDRMLFDISLSGGGPEKQTDGTRLLDDKSQLAYADQKCTVWSGDDKFVHFKRNLSLYKIYDDPSETIDVSGEHPEQVNQLNQAAERWFDGLKNEPGSFRKPVFYLLPEGVERIRIIGSAAYTLSGNVELNNNPVKVMQGDSLVRVSSVCGTKNWSANGDGAAYRIEVTKGGSYDLALEGRFTAADGDLAVTAGMSSKTVPLTAGNRIDVRNFEMPVGAHSLEIRLENVAGHLTDPFELNTIVCGTRDGSTPPAEAVWIHPRDGVWETASNWSPGGIPSIYTRVVLSENSRVSIQGAVQAASLRMQRGELYMMQRSAASLLIDGDLLQEGGRIQQRAGDSGKIRVNGDYSALGGSHKVLQKNRAAIEVAGNLTASPDFEFSFVLNSGDCFGNLLVRGVTALNGAKVQFSNVAGNTSVSDDVLLLIRNSSRNPVSGDFGNAVFGETSFRINDRTYVVDLMEYDRDGIVNDVVLNALP